MIRIQLYFFAMFRHLIFIQSQVEDFDVTWDQELMANDQDLKCGIQDKYTAESSARVINGKMVRAEKYAWKAEILHLIFYSNNTIKTGSVCSGSVISEKAILTAAHCLCRNPSKVNASDDAPDNICRDVYWRTAHDPKNPKKSEMIQLRNQNHLYNQIHYTIGPTKYHINRKLRKLIKDPATSFRENVEAFIYKYEPTWWEKGTEEEIAKKKIYWKNGDIGLIIDKSGLDLKAKKVIPVCLPVPSTFENDFEVTAAGTGAIYEQYLNNQGKNVTSCMTTEGLARKKGTQYSSTHPEFLQCKNYDRQKKDSCVLLTSATVVKGSIEKQGYKNRYLSANMDVSFPGPKQLRIEIPKDDECWRLTTKVQQAYMQLKNQIDLKMEDGQGPYRIAVFDDDDNVKDWKEKFREWDKQSSINGQYCYNLLRVGKAGICETEDPVYKFGFCSDSCYLPDPSEDYDTVHQFGLYWEIKANYYENQISANDEHYGKFLQLP